MTSNSNADERNDVAFSDSLAETLTSPPSSFSVQKLSVPTLPFDIMVEILSLLPIKSLMQLQCVCKSWKSLISDPKFAKKLLRASMSITRHHHLMLTFINVPNRFLLMDCSLSSLFAEGTTTAMELEYPLEINQTSCVQFVGSCHGILCFQHDNCHVVLLWNPSIRKFTKLPPFPKECGPSFYFSFGYDNFSDSYKVVAVSFLEPYKVMIHTLGTNSWRKMQDLPFRVSSDSLQTGKFVSGTVNWLPSRDRHSPEVILSLDFMKESYQELLLPDFGGGALDFLDLEMFKDCLWILSHADTYTDIWVMKDFGNKESWTKLLRVSNNQDFESGSYVTALYVSEDDQVLLDINQKFVIYNSRDGTCKDCNIQNINGSWMRPTVFLESLISPCV